jgi:hypothetical protein
MQDIQPHVISELSDEERSYLQTMPPQGQLLYQSPLLFHINPLPICQVLLGACLSAALPEADDVPTLQHAGHSVLQHCVRMGWSYHSSTASLAVQVSPVAP